MGCGGSGGEGSSALTPHLVAVEEEEREHDDEEVVHLWRDYVAVRRRGVR